MPRVLQRCGQRPSVTVLILLWVVLAPPGIAMADVSFYAGAGAGGVRVEGDLVVTTTGIDTSADPDVVAYTFSSEGYEATDVGYRVFGGMRFGRYLAVEGGYVSFGSLEENFGYQDPGDPPGCNPATPPSGNCNRIPVQSTINQDIDLDGWELYAVGLYPFATNWEAFAKIGVLLWDLEFAANDIFPQSLSPTPGQAFIPLIRTTVTNGCQPQSLNDPACPAVSNPYDDDGTDLALGFGVNYKATEHLTLRGQGEWFDIADTDQAWLLGFDVIYNF